MYSICGYICYRYMYIKMIENIRNFNVDYTNKQMGYMSIYVNMSQLTFAK